MTRTVGTDVGEPGESDRRGGFPSDVTNGTGVDAARVHLVLERDEVRERLADWLGAEYEVTRGSHERISDRPFDACVVDGTNFRRCAGVLDRCKTRADPAFLPVLLVDTSEDGLRADLSVWDRVDDLVRTPLEAAELRARLSNLVERRRTSLRLAERERALERTTAELDLKERAMDAAPSGVTITDPDRPDNPTVYANGAFERITGYDREGAIGRNMRFLQGESTDGAAVRALREGIEAGERTSVTLRNYRADGTRFWNRVDVAPVRDGAGRLTNYVGFQTDVTDETVREQRLSVLNRVMRHDLANDLTVILGYADELLEEVEDPDRLAAVTEIRRSAERLRDLGEGTNRVERVLRRCREFETRVDVGRTLAAVGEDVERAYPGVDPSLAVEGGPWHVDGNGLEVAFRELLENAIEHGDDEEPAVSVGPAPGPFDRVEVRVADDGPGVPDCVVEMLRNGRESQLTHGDGLGLWLVYWIVTLLGGDIAISSRDAGGTVVAVTLPVGDAEDP